jgi:hypothetical protein
MHASWRTPGMLIVAACSKGPSVSNTGAADSAPAVSLACDAPGARASATLEAPNMPTSLMDAGDSGATNPPAGTATFVQTASGVDLTIRMTGLAASAIAKNYPAVIHEGTGCADPTPPGTPWGGQRGQGAFVTSTGSGLGVTYYTRSSGDPNPWTIGDMSPSDLVGHVLVVDDPGTNQPIVCGPIVLGPSSPEMDAGLGELADVSVSTRAVLAGLCIGHVIAGRDSASNCPDPGQVAGCACAHCELGRCMRDCAEYLQCLQEAPDACAATCTVSGACGACMSSVRQCMFGFCQDTIACSPPVTQGGPCSQLEACCALQGDRAQACLAAAHQAEQLGGDITCNGLLQDKVVLTNLLLAPCAPDAN